jgi:hypothetical protein
MTTLTHSIAGVAALLLLAGCTHHSASPTDSTTAAAADTKLQKTRLSEAEVIRISKQAAERDGFRLSDYKEPRVHFEFTRRDQTWTVFYDGKIPAPGHHFLVWVDDQTGKPRVMRGE